MRLAKYKILILLLIISIPVYGQIEDAGVESIFKFGYGARAMGMGHAFTAMADDATAVHWNSAGLEYIYQQSITLFHASLYEGALYDFFGYAYPTLNLGTFGFGLARLGATDIVQRDSYNRELGTFSMETFRVYFSYAKKWPFDLATGISVKVERQAFQNLYQEGTLEGIGVGMDLGLMYRPSFFASSWLRDWSLGLNVQNLFAPTIRPGVESDVLPLNLKFGVVRTIRFLGDGNKFNVSFDLNKSTETDLKFNFGTEYRFQEMGMLRLGYDGNGLAFGAGVQYSIFQFDYAFGNPSTSNLLEPLHRLSLSINFGLNRDEMFAINEDIRKREEERIIAEIREADKQRFIAEHLQNAQNYFESSQYLDAIVEYQQVIGADPFHQNAKIMLDSANVMLQNEVAARQDEAVRNAVDKNLAEADQRFVDARFERGRLFLEQNQFTEALIEFNLALERDPDNQTIENAIQTTRRRINEEIGALVQRGKTEFQNQNYSEALRLLSEARLLSNEDPQVLQEIQILVERIKIQENIQRGLMLYDIGEYGEALQVFENVLESDPNNEFIKQYYEKSQVETFGTTEKMNPETERRYLEGMDKFLTGKYEEAIQIWEKILEEHPYNKKVLDALEGARDYLKRTKSNRK